MGINLEFWTGDSRKIIKATRKLDFEELNKCILKKADFSLHLQPKDLNTLSRTASKYISSNSMGFRENLNLIFDTSEFGLFEVRTNWVKYVSEININDSEQLAIDWYNELKEQYHDEKIRISKEGIIAVTDLIEICKFSRDNKHTVFHFWAL